MILYLDFSYYHYLHFFSHCFCVLDKFIYFDLSCILIILLYLYVFYSLFIRKQYFYNPNNNDNIPITYAYFNRFKPICRTIRIITK